MALVTKLAEDDQGSDGRDKITLKVDTEIISHERSPIVSALPGGSLIALDFGRILTRISLSGIVDLYVTELFVDNVVLGPPANTIPFTNEVINGNAAWDASTTPVRATTPKATIVGASPSYTAPTTLFLASTGITNAAGTATSFFANNEVITGATSGATAQVNEALPQKDRLEQIAANFYSTGVQVLTCSSGTYTVQIKGLNLQVSSFNPNFYTFKMELIKVA